METLVYTANEASELLHISKNHVYSMIREKRLPVLKLGKRLLIPKSALLKMLEVGNA